MTCECKRCGKAWESKAGRPKQCRWCKSPYWEKEVSRVSVSEASRRKVRVDAAVGKMAAVLHEAIADLPREERQSRIDNFSKAAEEFEPAHPKSRKSPVSKEQKDEMPPGLSNSDRAKWFREHK